MRTGPDLAAIGERNPSPSWHHEHLLNPRSKNAWSFMPAVPFLYKREKIVGERSPRALALGREWTVIPGERWVPTDAQWAAASAGQAITKEFWLATPEEEYQILPTPEADALVAYLVGLKKTAVPLPEANEP
jgi:cbb3-type cytochrome oxidase cytochrome c subunit